MPDPKNPYQPYTQRWQDHDRAFDEKREADRRRDWDMINRSNADARGGASTSFVGVSRVGRGDGRGGLAVLLLVGLGIGFFVLQDRFDSYWIAGGAIGAALLLLVAIGAFFRTAAGQFLLKLIAIAVAVAAAGVILFLIYSQAGTEGLVWTGIVIAGVLAVWFVLTLLRLFFRTTAGRITLWLAILVGIAFLALYLAGFVG